MDWARSPDSLVKQIDIVSKGQRGDGGNSSHRPCCVIAHGIPVMPDTNCTGEKKSDSVLPHPCLERCRAFRGVNLTFVTRFLHSRIGKEEQKAYVLNVSAS